MRTEKLKNIIAACLLSLLFFVPDASGQNTTETSSTIKVMSYNIHHCNPPSKPEEIDVDAIVRTIKQQAPDLVALQEVDVHTGRSGSIDQAKVIAEMLGMHYFFAKAIDYDGGEYGQAILSKYPMTDETIHRLPSNEETKGEPRIVATAKVQLPSGKLILFGTVHLDAQRNPTNRLLQAASLNEIAAKEKLPFVLAGDFNAVQSDSSFVMLQKVFQPTCLDCPFTIPVVNPRKTIDFILFDRTSPWQVLQHHVVEEHYASDHLPIVATLRIVK